MENAIGDLLWKMVFATVKDYAPAKLVSQCVDGIVHVLAVPLDLGLCSSGDAVS